MSWSTHINMVIFDSNKHIQTTKELAFADRNAAFCYRLNDLLKLTSIESLRFISELVERIEAANPDLENNDSEADDLGLDVDVCPFNPYQKVVIDSEQLDPIIADIDRLFLWCDSNITLASKVFRDDGWKEADIKQGIAESTKYTPDQFDNQQSGDPDFVFCTLRSMQGLLRYAKDNNMSVIYENLMEC